MKFRCNVKVTYRVSAGRDALGNLERISRIDDLEERDLIRGQFKNFGTELRFLHRYPIGKKMMGVLASGVRYYEGITKSQQGQANDGYGPDFNYNNPDLLEGSDFNFPSRNIAGFAEHILWLNKKLSVSAGLRFEHISTASEGYYREQIFHPLTNQLIFDSTYQETSSSIRSIFLGGIGVSYRFKPQLELYGNIAQNYRAINFSDLRILNPNQQVDPDISDEKGFNSDLGIRGQNKKGMFDVSIFYLYYANKIGVINSKIDEYNFVRLRTNVGMAYSTGLELFAERIFKKSDSSDFQISVFTNASLVYSRYGIHEEAALSQNLVELVPPIVIRAGISLRYKGFSTSLGGNYVHKHYSDGTNAEFDPNAVAGTIPSYYVLDFNLSYKFTSFLSLKGGINNFTNNKYFTRRATSYPGPGIVPSDGIGFYTTLQISF